LQDGGRARRVLPQRAHQRSAAGRRWVADHHKDETATVEQWGRDAVAGPDVVAVRQNLALIVDGGQPVAGLDLNAGGTCGTVRNQLQYTWRSGVGMDAIGNLVYVGGGNMTLKSLATALTEAGANRAMQLDIHSKMVDMYSYQGTPAAA
jgi:Phosphodiester glycosidase